MAHVEVAFIGAKHPHIFPHLEIAHHYAEDRNRVVEPDEQGMSYYQQLGARYRVAAHIVRRLE